MRTFGRGESGTVAAFAERPGNSGHAPASNGPGREDWPADASRSDEDKLRELYHLAFGRDPDVSEIAAAKGYIEQASARP